MFKPIVISSSFTNPRSFLALNSDAIQERLNAGMEITAIHKELMNLVEKSNSQQTCSYRTLLRFIAILRDKTPPKEPILKKNSATPPPPKSTFIDATKTYDKSDLI